MLGIVCELSGGCIGLGVAFLTVYILHKFYKNVQEKNHFTELRKRKQTERKIQFQEFKSQFATGPTGDEKIVELSFTELREKLQNRQLSCQKVLHAFISKSLKVQDELNCITEFIPDAMKKAKDLDKLDGPTGPLFGMPFCVKDDTAVVGMDSTCGFSRLLFQPSTESAVIVQVLEGLGAIPFCRTNIPQSCLSVGSDNPIFGQTLNPLNKWLGPGGSSSGSAALVGAGGCPFGTGTDSGGSLRIPAQCCGISTLRSTSNRLSDFGCLHCSPNLTTVPGILTKKSADLGYIYQLMISYHNEHPLDARVPKIPWDMEEFSTKRPLRIGYYTSFTRQSPVGDIAEAILKAKTYLQELGHTLIPFEMPDQTRLWTSMMMNDSMRTLFLKNTKNDAIGDSVSQLRKIFVFFPVFYQLIRCMLFVCRVFNIDTEFGQEIPPYHQFEQEDMTKLILKKMENLDLLLCPTFPFVALPANKMASVSMKLQYSMMYPYIWNLVNFPAGVAKFGIESGKNWPMNDSTLTQFKQDVTGMPIGVQIVGKPYQEEQVLRVLAELDKVNE